MKKTTQEGKKKNNNNKQKLGDSSQYFIYTVQQSVVTLALIQKSIVLDKKAVLIRDYSVWNHVVCRCSLFALQGCLLLRLFVPLVQVISTEEKSRECVGVDYLIKGKDAGKIALALVDLVINVHNNTDSHTSPTHTSPRRESDLAQKEKQGNE